MPTPLPELLASVPTLNDPGIPIVYSVEGDTIVARWDVVSAQTLYPNEIATLDRDFSVTVTFDEGKGTYKAKDHDVQTRSSIGLGGLGWSRKSFSGTKIEKSFSLELGGISKTPDGVQPGLAWSFDTARIKEPLFAFLTQHGWEKKRGLFG